MLPCLLPAAVVVVETAEAADPDALHPEEAACVERAAAKRRRQFAAGRVCARRALADLGVSDFPLLPDADRVPLWPAEIVGSITHSAGYAAAAVARRGEVTGLGVDVEGSEPLTAALWPRVLTPRELERLAQLPMRPGLDWPKLCFSAKEAAYKSYFPLTRHVLGFQDVELEFDAEGEAFVARLVAPDAPDAAGRRALAGRFVVTDHLVATAVVLGSEA